jgi:hypothetical protein
MLGLMSYDGFEANKVRRVLTSPSWVVFLGLISPTWVVFVDREIQDLKLR